MVKKVDIQAVLETLDKKELVRLIAETAERDERLSQRIESMYGDKQKGRMTKEQGIKPYRDRVKAIVKHHTGRKGMIFRSETSFYAADMIEVLKDSTQIEDVFLGLEVAFLILEEAVEAIEYADDSNGDLQYIAEQAYSCISEISEDAAESSEEVRIKLFERILEGSRNPILENWSDWIDELWTAASEFADLPEPKDRLVAEIEQRIAKLTSEGTERYGKYEIERLKKLLLHFAEKHGDQQQAEQLLQENRDLPSFRQTQIDRYLAEGQAEAALRLAEEGEKKDAAYPGLVHQWKLSRYAVYRALKQTENERKLAEELFFEGEYDCYADLEKLAGDQSEEFYAKIKSMLIEKQSWESESLYKRLIEDKNDLPAQLEHVRQHPSDIEEYAKKLAGTYPEGIVALYKQHILEFANMASNRKQYGVTCRKIESYAKLAGTKNKEEIIRILTERYPNRSALLDELSRVK